MRNRWIKRNKTDTKASKNRIDETSSSDEKLCLDYFRWQIIYRLLYIFDIILDGFICRVFVAIKFKDMTRIWRQEISRLNG